MSDHEDLLEGQPPSIDPYEVLDLESTASEDQIKRAYRKAAGSAYFALNNIHVLLEFEQLGQGENEPTADPRRT